MKNRGSKSVLPAFDFSVIKNADVRAKVMHLRDQILASKNRIGTEFIKICRIVADVHGILGDEKDLFTAWAAAMGWSRRHAMAMVRASDRLSNIDDKTLERFSYTAIMHIANHTPESEVLGECVARAERGLIITESTVTEVAQSRATKPAAKTTPAAAPPPPPAPPSAPATENNKPASEPPKSAASPPTDETGQDDAESGSDTENRKEPAAGVFVAPTPPTPAPAPDAKGPPAATSELHTESMTVRDTSAMTVAQKVELDNSDLEAFCRKLLKCFDDSLPDNPWLIDKGRAASARASIGSACSTIRSAKQVCCPACCPKGDIEPDENCDWCRGHGGLPKVLAETIHL